ncbi:16S rRNA (cytosine(1402)-N(4))-methyltransferase RsmH [Thiohalobacter sp. IOR34]|uniref:16S rRNA (cytosine(1402)-N(4))-methyltransferase RsmH n=1 Tax=Thiohalobacter sp. IOR34 TaxID=3057176 RepID=UPI0025B1F4EE|nr:16S rRNA (cytosine(1402)-N(4))-methyltransferase RsmH [Thiohalobacter sp. IOR34]WJW75015.1 16S rRNA (cytosine(1402)-N(4))-methyltransferase RsmH [Thiohalobacter sp. IOR34]
MTAAAAHRPVLLQEALDALAVRPGGLYLDGTFGRGGHAAAILERLGPEGRLYAMDKDPDAVQAARERFGHDARFHIERGSFAMLGQLADRFGIRGRVDGILFDLGVSSPQLDDARRGFSFLRDGPLDMRMDPQAGESAAEWLNRASEAEIAEVLWRYGEERFSRRIARAIVAARRERPIESTARLAEIVAGAVPGRERHKHPATRSFQAIRIHVNRELADLEAGLAAAVDVLAPGGRLAVISFHSLEDRLVKRFLRREAQGPELPRDLPVTGERAAGRLRLIGKAIRPGKAELEANPRARSAVLRVAERRA